MTPPATLPGLPILGYAEQPRRQDPSSRPDGASHLFHSPERRGAILREALDAGMRAVLLTHERDVASFLGACRAAALKPSDFTILTTDGAVFERLGTDADNAEAALTAAIDRKRRMLGVDRIDGLVLLDYQAEIHTPAILLGAGRALELARTSGAIGFAGLAVFRNRAEAASVIERGELPVDIVIGSCNALDRSALDELVPACSARAILFYAVQTYNWLAGVPFARFPNAWRLRNMTQSFFGMTVGQAHLRWLLGQTGVAGAFIAQDEPGQAAQNTGVLGPDGSALPPPPDIEALLAELTDALTGSAEGWKGLLADERWEYRYAAEQVLSANGLLPA